MVGRYSKSWYQIASIGVAFSLARQHRVLTLSHCHQLRRQTRS